MPLTGAPSSCRARFTDADALAALRNLGADETCVEVPADVLRLIDRA